MSTDAPEPSSAITAKSAGSTARAELTISAGEADHVVGLAGNPNVGKSTVFNALTGLRQHTGNWPGKTVARAEGVFTHRHQRFKLVDLPGTYSLQSTSEDESIARDFIESGQADCTVVVMDATALERNLNLAIQVMRITPRVVVCVNLIDEARAKGITIDIRKLNRLLGVPVVATAARSGEGIDRLIDQVAKVAEGQIEPKPIVPASDEGEASGSDDAQVAAIYAHAEQIVEQVVRTQPTLRADLERRVDRILTHPVLGLPLMLGLLALVLWLTIFFMDLPSGFLMGLLVDENGLAPWLSEFFGADAPAWLSVSLHQHLLSLFNALSIPAGITGFVVDGVYLTLAWVVAVMLPPMAIFFPMFTLLEDLGYLPRVAFNLDGLFRRAGAHGKQSLTMAMGFGCNAAGVVACRVIDSPRERMIAIVTNNFTICNGRFPTIIAIGGTVLAGMYQAELISLWATGVTLAVIVAGLLITLAASWLLSNTLLKGKPSTFSLELPPYRKPAFGQVLYRSLIERTLFVLGRACVVSIPAGAAIWLVSNFDIAGKPLADHLIAALGPLGWAMGLDGAILLAYVIAIPANEIVLPTIIMLYIRHHTMIEFEGEALMGVLHTQGWTAMTAICLLTFVLLHNPCGTTIWTIYRETRSAAWTALATAAPVVMGIIACIVIAGVWRLAT